MTVFLSRSGWGALPPNRESPPRDETSMIFVHHSATTKPNDIDEAKQQVAAIQWDHLHRSVGDTDTLWRDVAYNLFVGPGVILEGRGWDVIGGGTGPGNKIRHHSGSWDNVSVSICVLGNYQTQDLDDATRTSLVAALAEARARYGDALAIMGDRDVNTTACCGDNLYPLLNDLWVQSSLLGDDMALTDEDIHKVAEAVWSRRIESALFQAPAAQFVASVYDEIKRDDLLSRRIADAVIARIPQHVVATVTYDNIVAAVRQVVGEIRVG